MFQVLQYGQNESRSIFLALACRCFKETILVAKQSNSFRCYSAFSAGSPVGLRFTTLSTNGDYDVCDS